MALRSMAAAVARQGVRPLEVSQMAQPAEPLWRRTVSQMPVQFLSPVVLSPMAVPAVL
jgi:hypothetical protein